MEGNGNITFESFITKDKNFIQIRSGQGVFHVHPETVALDGFHSPLVIGRHLHLRGIIRGDFTSDGNSPFQFAEGKIDKVP